MASDFKSDKQRKAVMAKLKGNPRSDVKPSFFGKLKAKEQAIKKKLIARREKKGRERIEKEIEATKRERIQLERLQTELKVEKAREDVARQRRETQAQFKEISKARRARKLAPLVQAGKRAVATGKRIAATGKAIEKATRPKKVKRKRARPQPQQEQDFFQI